MAWLDFLMAPEATNGVTAPASPTASTWDQFMAMIDHAAGPQQAAPPSLNAGASGGTGTPQEMPFAWSKGAGRTTATPGSMSGGDFSNILTAGVNSRPPPTVAPLGGFVQGGVARRQNNAGPLAAAALAYFGGAAMGGGAGAGAEGAGAADAAMAAAPADAAALGAEGGAAVGAGAPAVTDGMLASLYPETAATLAGDMGVANTTPGGAMAVAPKSFGRQFYEQALKQVGFPDLNKSWTGADYAQALNTLSKMGGPKRTGNAPASMKMPQLQEPSDTRNPGPVFGQNIMPSTLDIWRPKQRDTLFGGTLAGQTW